MPSIAEISISQEQQPLILIPAEMPQIREYRKTTSELLTQIKTIYESWPTEEYGITYKQALHLYVNDCPTSRLIKNQDKLKTVKETVPLLIPQESQLKPEKLVLFGWVTDYDIETLKLIDEPSNKISADILKQISKQNSGPENKQKRLEIINRIIQNQTSLPKREKLTQKATKTESFQIDITDKSFSNQAKIAQTIKQEYKNTTFFKKRMIGLDKAIRLIHKRYKDIEKTPKYFTPKTKTRLKNWFQNTLPKYGIIDIDNIDFPSFYPLIVANPEVFLSFDYQSSDIKLDVSVLKQIVTSFPNELYFTAQKIITDLFLQEKPDETKTKEFIQICQRIFKKEVNNLSEKEQRDLIHNIYFGREYHHPIIETPPIKIPQPDKSTKNENQNYQDLLKKTKKLVQLYKEAINKIDYLKSTIQQSKNTVDMWWLDSQHKIPKREQVILTQIFLGKDPYKIAQENEITVENVYALFTSAFSRRHFLS
jgi:hypothetical protein